MKFITLIAAALMATVSVAGATTYNIGANENFSAKSLVFADSTSTFRFNVTEDLSIDSFDFGALATRLGHSSVENVSYGFGNDRDSIHYQAFEKAGKHGIFEYGDGSLDGGIFKSGDSFYLSFLNENCYCTGLAKGTIEFDTESVSAVPLPAGAPLLFLGLGALGYMARRKT